MTADRTPGPAPDSRILTALALLLVQVVLTLAPPATSAVNAPAQTLVARLYPGVPPAWIITRVALALVSAGLLASAGWRPPQPGRSAEHPARPALGLALVAGSAAVAAAVLARRMDGIAGQAAWVLLVFCPALLFEAAALRRRATQGSAPAWLTAVPVVAGWIIWRVGAAAGDGRQVDAVAMWGQLERLHSFSGQAMECSGVFSGCSWSNSSLLLPMAQGALFAQWTGMEPDLTWVATAHALGTGATALLLAALAARLAGGAGAVAASVVFLFAPTSLLAPLAPAPTYLVPLLVAALALSLTAALTAGSPAALTALAATAGLATGLPQTMPVALLAVVALGRAVAAQRGLGWATVGTITAVFVAASAFGLPQPNELATALRQYLGSSLQVVNRPDILLEQVGVQRAAETVSTYSTVPSPLGAALASIGIPRSPASLLGDTLLDPLGTGLAMAGLTICLRQARRWAPGRWLAAGLFACLLPGALSPTGRILPDMVLAATVPLTLLACLGLEALRSGLVAQQLPERVSLALLLVAIAGVGTFAFDVVDPRILPRSSLGIGLQSGGQLPQRLAVLHHPTGDADFLHVAMRAEHGSDRKVSAQAFDAEGQVWARAVDQMASGNTVYLWSPAVEEDGAVTARICGQLPAVRLYTMTDQTGLSRCFAAAAPAAAWQPDLPAGRWTEAACPPDLVALGSVAADTDAERDGREQPPPPPSGPQRPVRADLSRSDLVGALLGGEDLTSADIQGASLNGAKLRGANLNGARLRGSDLRDADLTGANLNDADLRDTDLRGAVLEEASLDGAKLRGLDLTGTDLAGANLHGADLARAKLEGMDLTSTNLHEADLAAAQMHDTQLAGMNLSDADLSHADLTGADLTGAELARSELARVDLTGAKLGGSRLVEINARRASLARAQLEGADLSRATLKRAVLDGAGLEAAVLRGASLKRASLAGSDLRRADLSGVDLRGAHLAGARLEGTIWSGSTCPDGTNSDTNGGTCCGHHVGDPPAACEP